MSLQKNFFKVKCEQHTEQKMVSSFMCCAGTQLFFLTSHEMDVKWRNASENVPGDQGRYNLGERD